MAARFAGGRIVRCPNCDTQNPERAKFCQECGTSIAPRCPECRSEISPNAKFCVNCGTSVASNSAAQPAPPQIRAPQDRTKDDPEQTAERRQLTVLFSDLVGSTAISEALDPEDYRELIAHYRAVVTGIVEQYNGHVANFVGDGVVVYFGYPVAHEGSAYAAVLAALEIAEAAPAIAGFFPRLDLSTQVRVGLHTGSVVVGQTGSGDHIEKMSLFGDTPNIAARIQAFAAAGQVVTSAATRRLAGAQLMFRSLGPQTLHGVRDPMELYQAMRPSSATDIARRQQARPATPVIGRKAEIALVSTRWEEAQEGDGQVMLVTGEAGIGKSRIIFSLDQELPDGEANRLVLFGSVIHKNSPFYSAKEAFGVLLNLSKSDTDEVKRRKLHLFLDGLDVDQSFVAPPIANLLGFGEDFAGLSATSHPEQEKLEAINAMIQVCGAMSDQKPLLMVIDDAHWIDPSTLEFVSRWISLLQRQRCLLLITARPEFVSPWKNLAHVTALELNRLGRRETIALIENIAQVRPPEPILKQIVLRTDGVPLFIEELTKMVIESGLLAGGETFKGDLSLAIPASLQDSLMSRLDRLTEVRQVAQIASTIGRTFDRTILCRVHAGEERTVDDALAKLIDADLIVPVGGMDEEAVFQFRHALVQEAAYQSMLRTSRAKWHGRIAAVLENLYPETAKTEPELLGHHFMLAGDHLIAEGYWRAAASVATERSANPEAIEHLQFALSSLAHLPETEERDRREMDLQIMIAVPFAFVNGYAHPSVRGAYARARELCTRYGELDRLFKVVYGQFRSSMIGGEYAEALENAEQLGSMLDASADPVITAVTYRSLGSVLTYLGRPAEALEVLQKGMDVKLSLEDRRRGLNFDVVDLGVAIHAYAAWSYWLCGRDEDALSAIEKALELAPETEHPFTLSFSLAFASWIYQFLGDEDAVRQSSARLITLSEKNAFHFWLGWGRVMNSWARRAELGEKALEMIEQGLGEWRSTASRLGLSYFRYLHADVAMSLGQARQARDLVAEAQRFEEESGEAFWAPELVRLDGEIAMALGDKAEGAARFRQAIDMARDMGMPGHQRRAEDSARQYAKADSKAETAES
ncbi:adenylate/guanylate cyclase domain-containing protein [Defluviimonas aestuarii]|nr:adenylate/guanylate cyclase domain-containing protein [Defluviimonas aestuarii]MDI3337208.1 adenylate/guanylate cyclase domain-containing protein [Defluviimonas aestuarii]